MTEKKTDTKKPEYKTLVITRIFDAPRELVWKAWTEPERIMQWWGPKIFTSPTCELDLRVGGKYNFCMRWPDGKDIFSGGDYLEIAEPERLVFTDRFTDKDGNIVPASTYGMGSEMDVVMKVTVTFEDVNGKTKMTLKHENMPVGETFTGAGIGWNESFDKLEASVKQS